MSTLSGGTLHNPVLRGFEPDPSIVRWRGLYVVATSTFEWFPGVRLHISEDLVTWRPAGHVLTAREQLDLAGIPDSGGIWAPSLSVVDDELWVVYTVVRTMGSLAKDLDNYLVTAPSLEGPWSEPVRLGSRGFDASMFHDDDGRHWLACVQWDPRPGKDRFAGISVQEYDAVGRRLVGDASVVLTADELIEGPNIYRRGDHVYLMVAQGGTGWNHGIAMARADDVLGPYEWDPQRSLLTTRDTPDHPLQKAGHGELVQAPTGEWYLAHLAGRPVSEGAERFCVTGRETCLQRVTWDQDGWLRLADDDGAALGDTAPREVVAVPAAMGPGQTRSSDLVDDFEEDVLDTTIWSSLRRPVDDAWLDLRARPGWLRLHGGQSPASRFEQAMIGTRLRESVAEVTTVVDVRPAGPRQRAGLAIWYDAVGYHYLYITQADGGSAAGLETSTPEGVVTVADPRRVGDGGGVELRFRLAGPSLTFSYRVGDASWTVLGEASAQVVSDDYPGLLRFTGAMAALRADDHDGDGLVADFDRVDVVYSAG